MDSVVHFIFPLVAALGARLHIKHGIPWVLTLSAAAVLLDIDHFIGVPRATLHNVFVVVLIPVILIILAFKYERRTSIKYKSLSVAALLFLISHPILDIFDDLGVKFFYPLSDKFYSFSNWTITTTISTGTQAQVLGPSGFAIIFFFLVLSGIYFLDEVIELMQKHHANIKKALKDAFREEEKEIEKEI